MAYTTTTLATLQARLAERYENVPFWTTREATNAINEALRVWQALTGYWKQRISITVPALEHWIPIPGSIMQRTRLELNNKIIGRSSLVAMKYGHPFWQSETTASLKTASGIPIPTTIKNWMPAGLSLVGIWPAPVTNQTVIIDGIAQTPILVNPGDYVDIGDEEFSTLLGFALHLLAFKAPDQLFMGTNRASRSSEMASSDSAPTLRDAFYHAAAQRNAQFRASDFYRHYAGLDLSEQPTHRQEQTDGES